MSTVASTITSKLSAPGSAQKKKSTSLPAETVDYLKAWMMSPEHIAHPYPTEQEKAQIMAETGIELKQLTNWFVNNRKRYWKPRVEARLQHQTGTAAMPTVNHGAVSPAAVSPLKRKSSGQSLLAMAPLVTEAAHPSIRSSSSPTGMVRRVSTVSLSAGSLSVASLQGVVSDNSISESYASSQYSSDAESGTEDCDLACDDEVSNEESVARTESVDVHILKPLYGPKPTIADVSILSSVPTERILCTYEHCPLKYSFPLDSIEDRKKVQSRRDAEITRLKRKFLKLYLDECGLENGSVLADVPLVATSKKRSFEEPAMINTPRKKFCVESPSLWKKACETAEGVYDVDLPTLEEATLLFGFKTGGPINV